MADARMGTAEPGTRNDGVRAVLGTARALLEELAEEGIEAVPAPSRPLETPAMPRAPVPTAAPRHAQLLGGPAWGADPSLEEVRAALGECTRCRLSEGRTQIVFGDGNPEAELLFVGEGPGQQGLSGTRGADEKDVGLFQFHVRPLRSFSFGADFGEGVGAANDADRRSGRILGCAFSARGGAC